MRYIRASATLFCAASTRTLTRAIGRTATLGPVAIGQRRNQNRAKCLEVDHPAQFLQRIALFGVAAPSSEQRP
jgi:hypothetical protein